MGSADLCNEDLRRVPVFEDLTDDQLAWLVDCAECLDLEPGEVLWEPDQEADAMFVVLTGTVHLYVNLAGQSVRIDSHRWGGIIGALPYSRMKLLPGKTVASEPTRILRIDKDCFPDMLREIPELGYRLVSLMADRVRDRTRAEQQREKMIALGKLSAGLAHELNNPAAAVQRTAEELTERLRRSNALVLRLAEHGLSAEQMRAVVELRGSGEAAEAELSTLERGDREDALAEWLEDQGVEDAWMMAEAFVNAGLDAERIREACDGLPEAARADALAWIESGMAARQLLAQMASASGRISNLVRSVKSYSHMDQSPDRQTADLHRGIEETLTMLAHSLKKKSVRLKRDFASDLPRVPVFVSELNQVWTNLIDNAIDAIAEGGSIEVATDHDPCSVYVRITDDGPGIPEDVQPRIFEPFYTTKPVGEGTGFGLDVVQRIVLQHEGQITVESTAGRTSFVVRLPREPQ